MKDKVMEIRNKGMNATGKLYKEEKHEINNNEEK